MGLLTSNFGFRTSDLGLKTLDFGLWTLDIGRQTSDDRLRTSDFRCGCPRSEVRRLDAFSRPDMCELRVCGFQIGDGFISCFDCGLSATSHHKKICRFSISAAIVHDGHLSPIVAADGYLGAITPFAIVGS